MLIMNFRMATIKNNKNTVKPVLSEHSKIDKTNILMTNGSLMKLESIADFAVLLTYTKAA